MTDIEIDIGGELPLQIVLQLERLTLRARVRIACSSKDLPLDVRGKWIEGVVRRGMLLAPEFTENIPFREWAVNWIEDRQRDKHYVHAIRVAYAKVFLGTSEVFHLFNGALYCALSIDDLYARSILGARYAYQVCTEMAALRAFLKDSGIEAVQNEWKQQIADLLAMKEEWAR